MIFIEGGVFNGPKSRGEEIACNLVAACRLPLGRPLYNQTNPRGRAMHAPTVKFFNLFVWAIHESPVFLLLIAKPPLIAHGERGFCSLLLFIL